MKLPNPFKRFLSQEAGGLSVETVIIFPLLLWAYAAMFIFWDAYKAQNVNLKATYTVADMISRAEAPMTPDYLDGANDVYQFLVRSQDGNDTRVSVVEYNTDPSDPTGVNSIMRLRWSYATGTHTRHADIVPLANRIPSLPVGSELIVVETTMTWIPPFNFSLIPTGLDTRQMQNLVFTSPRFVGRVRYDIDGDDVEDDTLGSGPAI
jgi:Flp pilus assembly protein TadG